MRTGRSRLRGARGLLPPTSCRVLDEPRLDDLLDDRGRKGLVRAELDRPLREAVARQFVPVFLDERDAAREEAA
jgi:hypothetical protein